ncbi:LysM and putative peptidoglycan-binding domain-containing protein 2 [Ananas comosus]|uniref:LysM and putative peptidoglycan-binding domain-containing protein 2 n=1 Tax=Ananas comosus TaxID=4615 RepID=A0A199UFJ8_ANACO|nr:LysM and putative peptidoglycan-binding domain-containing protein 2 [Ananas comosus]
MMQREKGGRNGSYEPQSNGLFDGFVDRRGGLFDGFVDRRGEIDSIATIPVSSSSSLPSSPPSSSSSCGGYIEHRVSKMDTLAGVAIKYGVEVADIRRLNSLMTDLQMFARKSLKIPLPGKHPPSPFASEDSANGRRRQKGDSEPLGFSRKAGKGLALRPKSGSRPDIDLSQQNLVSLVDPSLIDGLLTVRKSSSTSNLQDSDSSSSIWSSSKWSLKPDTFAWPIFDGLPKPAKPATARRNKAALD